MKGWAVVGYRGAPAAGSDVPRLHDFAAWEALALKSIRMRPSDCGCEVPEYAEMLSVFGRPSAALPLMDQAVATNPMSPGTAYARIRHLGVAGRADAAQKALSELSEKMTPDWPLARVARSQLALWRGDWAQIRQTLDLISGEHERAVLSPLLDALSRKDAQAARAAAAPLLEMIARRERIGTAGIAAVAAAGYPDQAADAFETLVAQSNVNVFQFAYAPPFAAMHRNAQVCGARREAGT